MKRIPMIVAMAATLGLTLTIPANAQETGADATVTELRAMVAGPTAADEDRALIRAFLDSDGVAAVAGERGVDLERMKDRVRTLEADEAAELADRVRGAAEQDADLVGGDTFVISSTAVIIALLVVILIVVS